MPQAIKRREFLQITAAGTIVGFEAAGLPQPALRDRKSVV